MKDSVTIAPYAGIMKRLPAHKVAGQKKQYLIQAMNYISTDAKIKTMPGNDRYNTTQVGGPISWAKRIYYRIGTDLFRSQFATAGGFMYKGEDSLKVFNQVKINNGNDPLIASNTMPQDTAIEVSGNTVTYLVDGTNFFKFVPNLAGEWEKLGTLVDVDGNDIEPIDVIAYQDRLFILVKNRNVILFSKNGEVENFSNSTDAGLIQIPSGNGGYPQRLIIYNGYPYVIHEDYFAPVTGSSAATYAVRPGDIVYGYGTRAPESVTEVRDFFGFLNSEDNEYYLSGGTQSTTSKIPLSYDIQLSKLINPVKASLTAAIHDPNTGCLRISYPPTGEPLNNAEALYSLDEEKWAGETYGRKIARYCLWNGAGDSNQLLTTRTDIGCLMYEGVLTTIDGAAIHYRLVTGDYADDYIHDVQFTEFYIDAKPFGTYTKMPLAYYMDGRNSTYAQADVTLQGEVINLGLIEIGAQDMMLERIMPILNRSKGRMIQFISDETVSNTSREIYSITCVFNVQNRRKTKWTTG